MTQKTYKTAQGKVVDLGALQLQNETVRAVGNMGVNARGDVIDGYNQPIDSKNQQVKRQYNRQTSNVQNQPISRKPAEKSQIEPTVVAPAAPEDFDDNFVKPVEEVVETTGGLAAAMAKARSIKKEPAPAKPAKKDRLI